MNEEFKIVLIHKKTGIEVEQTVSEQDWYNAMRLCAATNTHFYYEEE